MKTKIIKTESEYNAACKRIYSMIHKTDKNIEPDSPEGEELELLSLLVEKYEQENFPVDAPNPVEAIKFRMEQMKLKQIDVAPLFGGNTRVSEVLNGKRPLTLKMITLLNRYLGIPLESMVIGNNQIQLEPNKRDKLLNIETIKQYFLGSRTAII